MTTPTPEAALSALLTWTRRLEAHAKELVLQQGRVDDLLGAEEMEEGAEVVALAEAALSTQPPVSSPPTASDRRDWHLPIGRAKPDVAPAQPARPEIVCLCGSTRFIDTFQAEYGRLTDEGKIVLTVGRVVPQSEQVLGSARKVALDELHKRKIDLADRVLALNVGGYIGSSTRSEIEYATAHGKSVDYLEPLSGGDENESVGAHAPASQDQPGTSPGSVAGMRGDPARASDGPGHDACLPGPGFPSPAPKVGAVA